MPWFRVDDTLAFHHKTIAAGNAAMGLWVRAGAWSMSHPPLGFITTRDALRIGTRRQIDRLTSVGLWVEVTNGYEFGAMWGVERDEHRRKIRREVRLAVYRRDGFACLGCGATDDLTLDHIWPWSHGGSDSPANLRTLCRPCNSRKGARV